jgi:hypothetical protein
MDASISDGSAARVTRNTPGGGPLIPAVPGRKAKPWSRQKHRPAIAGIKRARNARPMRS